MSITLDRRRFMAAAGALAALHVAPAFARGDAQSAPPLVDAGWLKPRLGSKEFRIINLTAPDLYRQAHLPGAVFSDFGQWRVEKNGVPAMLPDVPHMEKLLGGLGVTREHHVILVPAGFSAGDVGVAARAFWTLKTLGHARVSILDGGIRGWAADRGNPLQNTPVRPEPATYKADYTDKWLADAALVRKVVRSGDVPLVDNRTYDEFVGMTPAGGSVLRSGTLPNAVLVPQHWFIDPRTGRFLPPEKIAAIHRQMGAKDEGEAITFCNTGHRAALGWFARHVLLGWPSRMYDGSLAEWTRLKPPQDYPVVRKVKL